MVKLNSRTHVVNPQTGRIILIGGRKYNDLVKAKLLDLPKEEVENKVVYETNTTEEMKLVAPLVKELKTPEEEPSIEPQKYLAQRNNKMYERKKTTSRLDLTNKVQKRTLELYFENKDLFDDDMPPEEIQEVLNFLLHKDMAGIKHKVVKRKKYFVAPIESESDFDSDSDSDEV